MNKISRRGLVLGAFALALPVQALANNWVKLGSRSVRLVGDHDAIPVTFLKGDFSRIKLKVRGNGIFIRHIEVIYSTGGNDRISIQYNIKPGGESRNIDLRGGDRHIRAIHLFYRSVRNSKGRSDITVYGRR